MAESSNRPKDIFLSALDLSAPAERAAFLDQACESDPSLRRQVEAMLQSHFPGDSFLEKPAAVLGPALDDLPRSPQEGGCSEGPGMCIGPYKLLQQIGEGGMGVVYMAEQQEPIRRMVALKIIKPGMDSQVIARFEAERQALALMDHQNIARVLDAGTTESGRPYFVMELVHGVPITTFCDDNQLSPRQRLELFIPVCHAIQHAHQKGIIHRDIKPSNILVTLYDDKPVPKVIDFGIAKAIGLRLTEKTLFTQFGVLIGTFEYMSPEQAQMNALGVDTRSDIYSLGVLLYELLTGTTPLEKTRLREAAWNEVMRLIKEEEPPRPSARLSNSGTLPKIAAARKSEPAQLARLVRGDLDWIVMKSLEKDRNRRYETANDLAQDVQRYLSDEPVQAGPPSAGYRLRKFVKRNRGPVTVALLVALTLLAGIIGTTCGLVEALWQRDEAEQARKKADVLAGKQIAARRLMEAHLALERARTHFDRDQVTPGLHWLVRGLEAVPETEPDLEHAFRLLLAGWGREIHPCKEVVTLADLAREVQPDGVDVIERTLLAQSPDGTIQVRRGSVSELSRRFDPYVFNVELWNTNTGKRLGPLKDLGNIFIPASNEVAVPALHLAFTPDGRFLTAVWRTAILEGTPAAGPAQLVGQTLGAQALTPATGVMPSLIQLIVAADLDESGHYAVNSLAGRWLLRTWDVATRKPLGPIQHVFPSDDPDERDFDKEVQVLIVSPDGKRLAMLIPHFFTDDDNTGVQLWDIPSGKRIGGLLPTRSLAVFSPDSRTLLTVGHLPRDPQKIAKLPPAEIRLWDTATGKAKQKPYEFRLWDWFGVKQAPNQDVGSEIHAAAFTADGLTLLTSVTWRNGEFLSHHLGIHRTGTNGRAAFLDNFQQPVDLLAVAPDGKTVLAQSLQEGAGVIGDASAGRIRLFKFNHDRYWDPDPSSHVRLEPVGGPLGRPISGARFIAFSPDGKAVLLFARNRYRLWDTTTGDPLGEPFGNGPETVLEESDPDQLIRQGLGAKFERDGKGVRIPRKDKIYRFALNMPRAGSPLSKSTHPVDHLPIGQTFVYQSSLDPPKGNYRDSSKIVLWDRALQKPLGEPLTYGAGKRINPPQFSPDGGKLLTLGDFAQLWDAATHKPIGAPILNRAKPIKPPGSSEAWRPDPTFAFSPDSKTVFLADGNEGRLLSTVTGQVFGQAIVQSQRINTAAFSPDSKRLIIGTGVFLFLEKEDSPKDHALQIYDAETGAALGKPIICKGSAYGITFSSDHSIIFSVNSMQPAVGPMDTGVKSVEHWLDTNTGRIETVPEPLPLHFSPDLRVFFRVEPDQAWMIGSPPGPPGQTVKFRLWDLARGEPRGPVMQKPAATIRSAVTFSPDRKLFVTLDREGVAHEPNKGMEFWNALTRMNVGRPFWKKYPLTATFSPDGKKLRSTMMTNLLGEGEQWLTDVPQPVRGTPEHLRLWVEVLTASEQDASGQVTELDHKTWQARYDRLKKLGGPP